MKSLVISLKTATERREHIERQFSQQLVKYEFFDALTPDLAAPLAEKMQLKVDEQLLSPGELACFMSHVAIWKKMVDENIPYLAVFEDDVYLGENAAQFLNDAEWIQSGWDVIKLEAFSKKAILGNRVSELADGRSMYELRSRHLGAAGYILSGYAAASLLAILKEHRITEPLDHILFDKIYHADLFSGLYQLQPALCMQSYLIENKNDNFGSTLEKQRVVRRKSESEARTPLMKLVRELKRVWTQLNTFLFKKSIEFR